MMNYCTIEITHTHIYTHLQSISFLLTNKIITIMLINYSLLILSQF